VSKTTSQDTPSAIADGSSGQECDLDGSNGRRSLFSFLERCVSDCIREERDPMLPGGPGVARAILLALHAEITTSTM
jgi:hypothetical protein